VRSFANRLKGENIMKKLTANSTNPVSDFKQQVRMVRGKKRN